MRRKVSTVTEDLLAYREYRKYRKSGDSDELYAQSLDVTPQNISRFSRYWKAVDDGIISPSLDNVIQLHNGPNRPYYADSLTFDRVVFKLLRLNQPKWSQGWVKYGPEEQDAALQKALVTPLLEEAGDDDLLCIRYSHFKRALTGE